MKRMIYRMKSTAVSIKVCFLILGFHAMEAAGFCPNGCQCDDIGLRVHCVNANLDTVPILLNPGTQHLDLSHNHIKDIMPGFAFYHEMKYLDMSHNEVESLGNKNFASQGSLSTLILSSNKLSHILQNAFEGLGSLKEIDLSDNSIESINDLAFKHLDRLKVLDISNNRIKKVYKNTFRALKGLQVLNLCKNNLIHISEHAFETIAELQELHLCSNSLKAIDNRSFRNLQKLVSLSLFNNKIENFAPDSFISLHSLKVLDVHDNLLKKFPTASVSVLNKIQELNIGLNPFSKLSSGAFHKLLTLRSLYISYCANLTYLDKNVFSNLENLLYLEVSFNPSLSNLPIGVFSSLHKLHQLVLRGNGLKSLEKKVLEIQSLQYLDVRDNPLVCNCSLKWLQEMERNKSGAIKVEEIMCTSPDGLRGRVLANLTDYDLECYSQLLIIASCVAVTIAFVLFAIIIAVIYYRHCKKMKTLVHDHWPEKIVATWRDPEYEKQIEDEEYTFQSAKSVSQIQIPVI